MEKGEGMRSIPKDIEIDGKTYFGRTHIYDNNKVWVQTDKGEKLAVKKKGKWKFEDWKP